MQTLKAHTMASAISFVLFLAQLRAVLSLPVSQDIKPVLSSRTQERTFVIDRDTILRQSKDSENAQSFDGAASDESVKRLKRETIVGNGRCSEVMQWILNGTLCVTQEKYDELKADYYDEDEMATVRPQTTPSPRRTPSPRMTQPPRTTTPPLTTPQLLTSPSPLTTLRPQRSPSPPKSIELSSSGCLLIPDLRLLPFLFFVLFILMRNY